MTNPTTGVMAPCYALTDKPPWPSGTGESDRRTDDPA